MKNNKAIYAVTANRFLLGLLMLVPGLYKFFVIGAGNVSGMLSGFGFPIPVVLAWVLMIAEVVTGIAIIANFNIRLSVIPPMIIMIVAGIVTFSPQGIPQLLMHLTLATNYWVFGAYAGSE